MKFLEPHWFWALTVLPLIFGAVLWDEKQRRRRFIRFAKESTWKRLAPEIDFSARIRKSTVWTLALVFLVVAMARPQWGTHEETAKVTGMDVMFVLDLSNSMEVEDVVPSRLQKAKHLIKSMADRLSGDRLGLVTFGASASVSCPLTTDSSYMLGVLQMMTPQMVATQGTDIGLGLETARRSMDRGAEETPQGTGPQSSHAIVLISDGEDWQDTAMEAARKIKESGMKLYVFGVGSQKGGPIPVRDENGALLTYKKDRKGQPVMSVFQPDALMEVAQAAGGKYWNVSDNESEVDQWLQDVAGLARGELAERKYIVFEDRFQYPLFIAVMLLLLEMTIPARKLLRGSGKLPIGSFLVAMAIFSSLKAQPAHAAPLNAYLDNEKGLKAFKDGDIDQAKKEFGNAQAVVPDSPELEFNEGVVQLQGGDTDTAIQSFHDAATRSQGTNPELNAKALYNLGEALTKKGDFKGATRSYIDSILQSQANHDGKLEAEARKNLELLAQEKQKQKQQKKDDQQKQDQKQQQDQQKKDDQSQPKSGDQQNQAQNKPEDKPQDKPQDKKDKKDDQGEKDKPEQYKQNQKQGFHSEKLRPEDADRVMDELRHQERELEAKLKKRNASQQSDGHDW
jgi:Ca-activated chloride channel family protein